LDTPVVEERVAADEEGAPSLHRLLRTLASLMASFTSHTLLSGNS